MGERMTMSNGFNNKFGALLSCPWTERYLINHNVLYSHASGIDVVHLLNGLNPCHSVFYHP